MVGLGKTITENEIDKLRQNFLEFRFVIPEKGNWRKEFGDYVFSSNDNGKTWTCIKNSKGSLLSEVNKTGHTTPDRKKSPGYYTRYHNASGGKSKFNPVSGTGGRYGKKTLD